MGTTTYMIFCLILGASATFLATAIAGLVCGGLGTLVMTNRYGWPYEDAFNRFALAGKIGALALIAGITAVSLEYIAMPGSWTTMVTIVALGVSYIAGIMILLGGTLLAAFVIYLKCFRAGQ